MSAKTPSPWSATQIGLNTNADHNRKAREVFKEEAKHITSYLQGVHHSNKIAHKQVNYSETVSKLGKLQETKPVYLQKPEPQERAGALTISRGREFKLREYNEQMSRHIKTESDLNLRKRLYNSDCGRKAVVHEVIGGTAPMPKPILFPQKAKHTQILALTGTLKAPDANKQPPPVKRPKKWLGDGAGWAQD